MKDRLQEDTIYFRDNEAQQYLKPGELGALIGKVEKAVLWAVEGPQASRGKRRLTIRGIEKKTGLSGMAVILACYRLTALGLLAEATPPKGWKFPKRWNHQGPGPKPSHAEIVAEGRARARRAK